MILEFELKAELRDYIERARLVSVFLNSNVQEPEDCVYADEIGIGYEATAHLLRLGHRRILFPVSLKKGESLETAHFSLRQRIAGYRKAMAEAGATPLVKTFNAIDGAALACEIVALFREASKPFSALVSGGAGAIYVEALRQGIDVPEKLSIVALDMPFSQTRVLFKLDRIVMDRFAMGREAGRMLLAKIEAPSRRIPSFVERPALLLQGSSLPCKP